MTLPPRHLTRLAFVVQNLNFGGMERVLNALVRALPAKGFEVHVIILDYLGHFAQGLEAYSQLHQIRSASKLSVVYPRELADVLRAIDPAIVHSHGGIWFQATRAAMMAHVPFVVHTDHGRTMPVPLLDRMLDYYASRWSSTVIAVSEPLADLLKRHVVAADTEICVIPNGIDAAPPTSLKDRQALRSSLGIPDGSLVIGSIGRLEPVKNTRLALRSLSLLGELDGSGSPLLILVGDGSQREALEAYATTLGISHRVKFLGWRIDAEKLYDAFDIFTLTSRSEGTSISLLEAMRSGVCPVVTDVGGNRAVLGPHLGQLLIPDNNALALTAAWQRLLSEPKLRKEISRRVRDRVSTDFSLDRMVAQHEALYRSLVHGREST